MRPVAADIICRTIQNTDEKQMVLRIRREVFIEEQDVPEEIEYDEFEDKSTHFICLVDGKPVGAGRLSILKDMQKVERIAILKEYRGLGLGRRMVETILLQCRSDMPIGGNAQLIARDFYIELGFKPVGDVFLEAGIQHIKMLYDPS